MDELKKAAEQLHKSTYQVLADLLVKPLPTYDEYTKYGFDSLPPDIKLQVLRINQLAYAARSTSA